MEKLANIHPGEVLWEEFLLPLKITAYRLSKDIKIPQTRTSEILKGRRRITADTALRLSNYFGNSAKFWLGLQDDYDLEEEYREKGRLWKGAPPPMPDLPAGSRVLELGCGNGKTLSATQRRPWQTTALDVSREAVSLCRKQAASLTRLLTADACNLPFRDVVGLKLICKRVQ